MSMFYLGQANKLVEISESVEREMKMFPSFHTELDLTAVLSALDTALIHLKNAYETYKDLQVSPDTYD